MDQPDDDERTTSMGLFNTAEAFWLSAMALEDEKVEIGHAARPIRFCYYHALELYLKALLRQKHSTKKIKEKFGHNIERLVKEAEALGLVVTDEDREVFSKADTNATSNRHRHPLALEAGRAETVGGFLCNFAHKAGRRTIPSGIAPSRTSRHRAINSLRASATIIVLRV